MRTLALIPARGGSKGIARKNLVEVNGKPLVAYSIAYGLASRSVDRVLVSTDDEEIRRIALDYGAEAPFLRPAELAGDDVLDHPVFAHALTYLDQVEGYRPDLVVHLRPTAPLRRAEWLEDAIRRLVAHGDADSIRSVSPVVQHPYRVFRVAADGYLDPVMKHEHPQPFLLRRQDTPAMYYYNCVLDVTRPSTIFAKKSMTGDRILPLIIPSDEAFDVDSTRDLDVIRLFAGRFA